MLFLNILLVLGLQANMIVMMHGKSLPSEYILYIYGENKSQTTHCFLKRGFGKGDNFIFRQSFIICISPSIFFSK